MASFAQNQPVSFTPYQPKFNTELYAELGMYKQGKYDQGVKQAQGYIDSIAGIQVGNEADKQYLRQKVQEVSSKANELGSGDFSDQHITGQIGSLAAAVANDTVVQTAQASALHYKKQIALMEEARKAGKSSVVNEWDLQRQAEGWLNSTKAGQSFNGTYRPYKDYRAKMLEVVKGLAKDSTITDEAFTTDASGKVVLRDDIVRTKLAGVGADKIRGALAASLDADDRYQMAIEGDYSFSNKTPQELSTIIAQDHQGDIEGLMEKRKELADQKEGLKDGSAKAELDRKISLLDSQVKDIKKNNDEYQQQIAGGDLRTARANYFTTKLLRNFSNAFSSRDVSVTRENNPMVAVAMERARMQQTAQLSIMKMQQDAEQFSLTYSQKERMHEEDKKIATGEYGGINQPFTSGTIPQPTIDVIQTTAQGLEADIKSSNETFLTSRGKDVNDMAWLQTQRVQYEKDPNSVGPLIKNHFDELTRKEKYLHTNQQLLISANKKADEAGLAVEKVIPKDSQPVRFNVGKNTMEYTPQEAVLFSEKFFNKILSQNYSRRQGTKIDFNTEGLNQLTPKERQLFNIMSKHYDGKPLNPTEQQVFNQITDYHTKTSEQISGMVEKRQKFINEDIAKRVKENDPKGFDIPVANPAQRTGIRSVIQGLVDRDKLDSDVATANTDEKASYRIITKPATPYSPAKYEITVSSEGKTYSIPLDAKDKQTIFQDKYEDAPENIFAPIAERIQATGTGSTNFDDVFNPIKASVNPQFQSYDFRSIKNFSVKGDIVKQNGGYALVLHVYNPITKQMQSVEAAPDSGLMDEKSVIQLVNMLNDNSIYKLITGKELDPETLKAIQEENKKAD